MWNYNQSIREKLEYIYKIIYTLTKAYDSHDGH